MRRNGAKSSSADSADKDKIIVAAITKVPRLRKKGLQSTCTLSINTSDHLVVDTNDK
jgi:hypothetical protein